MFAHLTNLTPPLIVVDEKLETIHFFEAAFVGNAVHDNEGFSPSDVCF